MGNFAAGTRNLLTVMDTSRLLLWREHIESSGLQRDSCKLHVRSVCLFKIISCMIHLYKMSIWDMQIRPWKRSLTRTMSLCMFESPTGWAIQSYNILASWIDKYLVYVNNSESLIHRSHFICTLVHSNMSKYWSAIIFLSLLNPPGFSPVGN